MLIWKRLHWVKQQWKKKKKTNASESLSNVFNLNNIIPNISVFTVLKKLICCRWLFVFTYSFRPDALAINQNDAQLLHVYNIRAKCHSTNEFLSTQIAFAKIDKCEHAANQHKILHSIYGKRTDNKSIYKHRTCSSIWVGPSFTFHCPCVAALNAQRVDILIFNF